MADKPARIADCGMCGAPARYVGIENKSDCWQCGCGFTTRERRGGRVVVETVVGDELMKPRRKQGKACGLCAGVAFEQRRSDGVVAGLTISSCRGCGATYDASGYLLNILVDEDAMRLPTGRPSYRAKQALAADLAAKTYRWLGKDAQVLGILLERTLPDSASRIAFVVTHPRAPEAKEFSATLRVYVVQALATSPPTLKRSGEAVTVARRQVFAQLCRQRWATAVDASILNFDKRNQT